MKSRAANEKVVEDLSSILEDIEVLMSDAAKAGGAMAEDAKVAMSKRLKVAQEQMENVKETLKDKAKMADEFVRENPWPAIGIAAGAGLLFGIVIARR